MKIRTKKSISLLLAICLLVGTLLPIPVSGNSTPEVTVTVTPESLSPSSSPQTVTVNIRVSPATSVGAYFNISYDSGLNYVGAESGSADLYISRMTDHLEVSASPKSGSTTDLGTFTFEVPACKAGDSFQVTVDEIGVYYSNTATSLDPVSQTIYVTQAAVEQGYTAALSKVESGDNAVVRVGDTWKCLVTTGGKAYNSGAIKVSYSTETLTFVAPESLENGVSITEKAGVVTILDYGALKNSGQTYELTFTAKAAGTASATLTSAAFGTSQSAVSGDLTAATLTNTEVEATIQPATHTVTLPGNQPITVPYGQSYTFTPEFENSTLYYDYAVYMIMNGTTTELEENTDGSYTIPAVTGDVQIEYRATAKTFSVTYQTTTGVTTLPVGGTAQYDQDYTITLPEENHYTLAVTDITIGGKGYSITAQNNGSVTIPGKAITGDVVVTIDRISTTVSVKGSGAVDAMGYATSAAINQPYTLTVQKDANYDYTVTATVNGKSVDLDESGNTYTISIVTAGPVVFTVEKTVNISNVKVLEYLKMNDKSVWLIKNTTNQLDGSVYAYKGSEMLWSDEYEAYCYLIISAAKPVVEAGDLTIVEGSALEVTYNGDVNRSGSVDVNDAQLVYDLYQSMLYGDFNTVSMEKFLRADVNADSSVDPLDAVAVISIVLK